MSNSGPSDSICSTSSSCLDANFVSLAGQRFIDFVGKTRTEIQNENRIIQILSPSLNIHVFG